MIVVLGMHAGGTSLVSRILMTMGVNMGTKMMGPVKGVPTWEDSEFVMVNASILTGAGGNWKNAPSRQMVEGSAITHLERMKSLIARRHGLWGFKDPRTTLTVEHWHKLLPDPVYVIVRRNYNDTAKSLLARGPSKEDHGYWVNVAQEYNDRIQSFVHDFSPRRVDVRFEKLLNSNTTIGELKKIAALVGVAAIPLALKEINFR